MTKLYVWNIDTDYHGDANTLFIWVLEESLLKAKELALEKVKNSIYPVSFINGLMKVLQETTPRIHEHGTVGMF